MNINERLSEVLAEKKSVEFAISINGKDVRLTYLLEKLKVREKKLRMEMLISKEAD